MSTRGTICVRLKDEDLDKDLHMKDAKGNDVNYTIRTDSKHPYLCVYCHHDSYIEKPGLGYMLPRNLVDYESVRDFVLQGARSGFMDPYDISIEDPEDVKPKNLESPYNINIPEEYFYLFENEKWYVKDKHNNFDFKDITFNQKPIALTDVALTGEEIKYIVDSLTKFNNICNECNVDMTSHRTDNMFDIVVSKLEKYKDSFNV